ncbi:pantoate--beta-alanine ligase [Planctomicrobium sp. SH527]|uniref:pantoate--beta-alanine ligase n=1 Tax=Planctomicrobium sp. SH527 TaxID=3448123 RepID=UPI003F5B39D3
MEVTSDISEVRRLVRAARQRGCQIGCVPTMGALHSGHISLVHECRKRVEYSIVTIFVNPTQFAPHEDLSRYPRPIEADLAACEAAGVDCVFTPNIDSLYPDNFNTWVTVDGISSMLEGEFRPGHFRGVTTVVAKLFNIVQPDVACFGSKDFQQQSVIRKMVADLDMPIEIVVCKTIREPDGLAMSSRNVYLSAEERQTALALSRSLRLAESLLKSGSVDVREAETQMRRELESTPGVDVQYAVIRDPATLQELQAKQAEMVGLIAAFVGKTRLIDHLTIRL